MFGPCPVVQVVWDNPEGFCEINESAYDPAVHKLFGVDDGDAKPSDGLKVEDLKAALAAKGIEIPEGVTKKADLAALLDAAPTGDKPAF